ncbi:MULTISPECIES: hypothetical protein [Acinetobacter]|uniref:Uncharacterized protein n=3 Tax=Gammaproteobacteria TaxID=1236 RepID=N9DCY9_9GAMM|nr:MULTISPECIES: hypothetical protein [Acinetobacter]ENV78580.1 hypothetical protein F942_02917 [Acinetobacter ursingii ANC 3649]MEC6125696.1 hypothetical protein [Acinetobacter ursingii]PZT86103.1 MAG: hypothetical protein DI627_10730 [Acinetobacter sp.]QXZ24245.1 hypothetical protein I6L31_05700 [Acinetobacter septicus]RSC23456.1 hypothetical protein EGS47_12195 [Acinetobacter sp. FDAARGOS_515]
MTKLSVLLLMSCTAFSVGIANAASGLISMSDNELAATEGQALMSLSYIAPNDSTNLEKLRDSSSNIGFYRLGMEAKVELNANIANLQLGCGGANGAGACDIDIKNVSLSGLNDGTVTSGAQLGSPTFSNPRASTSAQITNPFLEFAIKNPQTAATRQMVGFRLSAEAIEGLLSLGLDNNNALSATDGIQSLSGYLQLANLSGQVTTAASTFGVSGSSNCAAIVGMPNGSCQAIAGKLNSTIGGQRDFVSYTGSGNSDTKGISVPSMTVPFTKNTTSVITGNRMTAAVVNNINVSIPHIALDCANSDRASASACGGLPTGSFVNQLAVDLVNYKKYNTGESITPNGNSASCIEVFWICVVSTAKFQMASGSTLDGLNLNVTFSEALNMFHNIPLRGTGGYLALQNQVLRWPGANNDDIAQKGWWLSFKDPIDLGYLTSTNAADISAVLPQVAGFITQSLMNSDDIPIGLIDGLGAATNNAIKKKLNIDVSSQTANLTLNNLQLTSQYLKSNCYGNLKFC